MTLCPIALAVGCKKCPAFALCPLKSVIGDHKKQTGLPPPPGSPDRAAKPRRDA